MNTTPQQSVPQVPAAPEPLTPEQELDQYIDNVAELPSDEELDAQLKADLDVQEEQAPQSSPEQSAPQEQQPQQQAPVNGQAQQSDEQPAEGLRKHSSGAFTNAKGDITDEKGNVIAQRGFARRVYEDKQRLEATNQRQQAIINDLSHRSQTDQGMLSIARQNGLDDRDMALAIDVATRMKKGDVLGATKEVLALAMAQGYNASQLLGENVGDSIDMQAVKNLLDQRLGPLQEQRQQGEASEQAQRNAKIQYNNFMRDNPYADVHEQAIIKTMERYQLTPQQAYNQLRGFAEQNGFDFTRPLDRQFAARVQAARQQQAQGQPANGPSNRPMPSNGASTPAQGVSNAPQSYANADDTWGEIISSVMNSS